MVNTRAVVISVSEFDHLRRLVEAGGIGDVLDTADAALELAVLLRERLVRVVGACEVVTSAGHEFVRTGVVSGLTVSGVVRDE